WRLVYSPLSAYRRLSLRASPTLAPAADAQAAFAAPEVTSLRASPRNQIPHNLEETQLHLPNNPARSGRNPAALCVPLAPPCWGVCWAPCSFLVELMGGALAALAALAAAASDLLRSFYSLAWDIFSIASLLD